MGGRLPEQARERRNGRGEEFQRFSPERIGARTTQEKDSPSPSTPVTTTSPAIPCQEQETRRGVSRDDEQYNPPAAIARTLWARRMSTTTSSKRTCPPPGAAMTRKSDKGSPGVARLVGGRRHVPSHRARQQPASGLSGRDSATYAKRASCDGESSGQEAPEGRGAKLETTRTILANVSVKFADPNPRPSCHSQPHESTLSPNVAWYRSLSIDSPNIHPNAVCNEGHKLEARAE